MDENFPDKGIKSKGIVTMSNIDKEIITQGILKSTGNNYVM